jgi:glutathione S-transferase
MKILERSRIVFDFAGPNSCEAQTQQHLSEAEKENKMIKLYGIGLSFNVNKVRYCLNYLGLDFEWEQTNPMQGENQTEEYRNISATGKIPAIEVDGTSIFESNAINKYLATTNNSDLYPQDPKERAVVDAWSDYGAIHIANAMGRVLFNRVMAPMMGTPVDESSINTGLEWLGKYLPICDKQLGANKYIAGNTLTLADINLLAILDPVELAQIDLSPYSNVVKWRDNLKAQGFYQKCYKDYTQFVQEIMSAKSL